MYVKHKKNHTLLFLISTHKLYLGDDYVTYDVTMQEPVGNESITTDMKSIGIHLLNYQPIRNTLPFSIVENQQGQFCRSLP